MKVAVLGPAGTYSNEAATIRFGKFDPVFCTSLREVVEAVGSGRAEYACLPIENSTNGVVDLAVKSLLTSPTIYHIRIKGDVPVCIRHQLYSNATSLDTITKVYSHPQVWGQTCIWLDYNLPNATLVNADSTSHAVSLALSGSQHDAAIGGPNSSTHPPLVENCCDDPNNTTRFLVLSHDPNMLSHRVIKGPGRAHLVVRNTTIGKVAGDLAGLGSIKFIVAVPVGRSWKYSVYVDIDLHDKAKLQPKANWEVMGVESLRPHY